MRTHLIALTAACLILTPGVGVAHASTSSYQVVTGTPGNYVLDPSGKNLGIGGPGANGTLVSSSLDGSVVVLQYGTLVKEYQVAGVTTTATRGALSSPEVSPNGKWAVVIDSRGAKRINMTSGASEELGAGSKPAKAAVNDAGTVLILNQSGVARVCQTPASCTLSTWSYPGAPTRLLLDSTGKFAATIELGLGDVPTLSTWNLAANDWEPSVFNGAAAQNAVITGNRMLVAAGGTLQEGAAPGVAYDTPETAATYSGKAAAIVTGTVSVQVPAYPAGHTVTKLYVSVPLEGARSPKSGVIRVKKNTCLDFFAKTYPTGTPVPQTLPQRSPLLSIQVKSGTRWVPLTMSNTCWFAKNAQVRAVYAGEASGKASVSRPVRIITR